MLRRLRSMRASVGFMKRLFAVAEFKADRDGEPAPGPEHLLLGAARGGTGGGPPPVSG